MWHSIASCFVPPLTHACTGCRLARVNILSTLYVNFHLHNTKACSQESRASAWLRPELVSQAGAKAREGLQHCCALGVGPSMLQLWPHAHRLCLLTLPDWTAITCTALALFCFHPVSRISVILLLLVVDVGAVVFTIECCVYVVLYLLSCIIMFRHELSPQVGAK